MNGKNLALRPYIEKVEKICGGLNKQDLVALIPDWRIGQKFSMCKICTYCR